MKISNGVNAWAGKADYLRELFNPLKALCGLCYLIYPQNFRKNQKINFTKNLNRRQFIFYFKNKERLKLEFVFFPFINLSEPRLDKNLGIKIDSLIDMATNKTLAAYQRKEPKDIFDLYSLLTNGKLKLPKLIKNVNEKFGVEINEADLQARVIDNIDLLENIKPLLLGYKKLDKIKEFFIKESNKYLRTLIF